jgi:hypothetical protein
VRQIRPLDIVTMELQGLPSPQEHPEDRLIGQGSWAYKRSLHPAEIGKFVDPPDVAIPLDRSVSGTDRLSRGYVLAHPLTRSLWLIEVPAINLVSKEGSREVKWYAEFHYSGIDYRLKVTDDAFRHRLELRNQLKEGSRPEKHLCISIGVYFEAMDAYYKLVAGVMP